MKLEAVNPLLPEEVCVATITAVRGSYLWLQLEGEYQCPVCSWLPRGVASSP